MEKNWLIRTKSNHILGPVSKDKVLELYSNGSIKGDDELCSGNGYWFYLREDELVDRFLKGSEIQSFNPISEAKDVLTTAPVQNVPSEKTRDDVTMVGSINLSQLKDNEEGTEGPQEKCSSPIEDSQTRVTQLSHIMPGSSQTAKSPSNVRPMPERAQPKKERSQVVKIHPKQNFLQWLMILGVLTLFCLVYFRKSIMKNIFSSVSIIDSAVAQDDPGSVKKKSSLRGI
jgi:hypothetical protein